MRSQEQILSLIRSFASGHDSVRAVMMNGSRVNPNVPRDPLQDYDVVYFVRDVSEFRRQESIPAYFGDIMILQLPEEMKDPTPDGSDLYIYLMQFKDGTRIDLGIDPVSRARELGSDSLTVVLLDKDGILGEPPPPSDADYLTGSPTQKAFDDCCNEFWWLNPYVAKALWRDQLPLAKFFMEDPLRTQLIKMLGWGVVVRRGAPTALGKHGANLRKYMTASDWAMLERTYAGSDYGAIWESLRDAGTLFRSAARQVAGALRYDYPLLEDQSVSDFVQRIKGLPHGGEQV